MIFNIETTDIVLNILSTTVQALFIIIQAGIYYWFLNVTYKKSLIYAMVGKFVSSVGNLILIPLNILVLFPLIKPLGLIGNSIYILISYCITVLLQLIVVHAASELPIKKLLRPILISNFIIFTMSALLAFLNWQTILLNI